MTTFTTAPPLESERLTFRAHRAEDLAACLAMWSDPEVVKHIGGRVSTEEEVWQRILRYLGLWQMLGYGYWAMFEKASGKYVGELGFADFHRQLHPPIHGVPETGWALQSWAHGKGFATEALRTVLAWGDANLPSPHTVCIIDPGNHASIRVAHKAGYEESARANYKGTPTLLFTRG